MSKKNRKSRGRQVDSWMNDLRMSDEPLLPEGFGPEHLRAMSDYALRIQVEELESEGTSIARLVGVDASGHMIHLHQGEPNSAPGLKVVSGFSIVSLGGPFFKSEPLVRKVFDRMDIRAGMLVAEAWIGDADVDSADGVGCGDASQALGRAEAVLVDVLCPDLGYHRAMCAPMVRVGPHVTASLLGEFEVTEPGQVAHTPLAPFFPSHLFRETECERGSGGRAAS